MKYSLIYADPPWTYRDSANDGKRGASHKYSTMTVPELCRLPVWDLAADNCLLAMWWVPTQPEEALQVMKAWGFRLMTMKGFTWHKTNKKKGNSAIGMGHMTRANSEDVLFAVKGKLINRVNAGICQHITAARGRPSEKPAVIRDLLVELVGDIPRIELFSRGEFAGWDVWGNECSSTIELNPGYFSLSCSNSIWPDEVKSIFSKVNGAHNLPVHLQNKLMNNINQLKLDGVEVHLILDKVSALANSMEAL